MPEILNKPEKAGWYWCKGKHLTIWKMIEIRSWGDGLQYFSAPSWVLLGVSHGTEWIYLGTEPDIPSPQALPTMPGEWRPFETAPEDRGTQILAWRHDAGVFVAHYKPPVNESGEEDDWLWFDSEGEDLTGDLPTHWMPFPLEPRRKFDTTQALPTMPCVWTAVDGNYETGCGEVFYFTDESDTPQNSRHNYCFQCGKPIANEPEPGDEPTAITGTQPEAAAHDTNWPTGFHYVDIKSPDCEGWINLFFGNYILTMVSDVELARKIKAEIDKPEGETSDE